MISKVPRSRLGFPSTMFLMMFLSPNGCLPCCRKKNKTQPKDQMSLWVVALCIDELPSRCMSSIIPIVSGAVQTERDSWMSLVRPKSLSFRRTGRVDSAADIMIFLGLMFPWRMFFEWRYSRPDTIWSMPSTSGGRGPWYFSWWSSGKKQCWRVELHNSRT